MPKNPHAVSLGRKGGQSTSPAKKAACRANVAKARAVKSQKSQPVQSVPKESHSSPPE
jgi:hypothetical protein